MIKNIPFPKQKIITTDIASRLGSVADFRAGSLAGKLLVATPSLQESYFNRSVIYMCSHNAAGAMGIIINYPIENIGINDIMKQLNIKNLNNSDVPVHFGGPVESNRGFIIHSDDFIINDNIYQHEGMAVTSNADVLQAIAEGRGPKQGILALGYAGWVDGQLEAEMENGNWIVVSATNDLLFNTNNKMKWEFAIASLGFDIGNFSSAVGHA